MYDAATIEALRDRMTNLPFDLTIEDVEVEADGTDVISIATVQSGRGRRFRIDAKLEYLKFHDHHFMTGRVMELGGIGMWVDAMPMTRFTDQNDVVGRIKAGVDEMIEYLLTSHEFFKQSYVGGPA